MKNLFNLRRIFILTAVCAWAADAGALAQDVATRTVSGAGGVPLIVATWGNPAGPPILLIHNNGQSWASWSALMGTALDRDFHMIAFDLRGHGDSGKPWTADAYASTQPWADDVAAVLAATTTQKPVIVAVGFGGMIAMDYVRHYGVANVAGINLVQTQAGLIKAPSMDDATRDFYASQSKLHQSPHIADNLAAARLTARNFVADEPTQDWLDRSVAMLLRLPPYVRRLLTQHPIQNVDLVERLTVPMLFSVGTRVQLSIDAPLEAVTSVARSLPKAKVSVYAETGRSPYQENTPRFVSELAAFVKSAQPRGSKKAVTAPVQSLLQRAVTVTCKLDETIAFYRDVLNQRIIDDSVRDGARVSLYVDIPPTTNVRLVAMEGAGAYAGGKVAFIGIADQSSPACQSPDDQPHRANAGDVVLSVRVVNLDDIAKRAETLRVPILVPPGTSGSGKARNMMMVDPNGHIVEAFEVTSP